MTLSLSLFAISLCCSKISFSACNSLSYRKGGGGKREGRREEGEGKEEGEGREEEEGRKEEEGERSEGKKGGRKRKEEGAR